MSNRRKSIDFYVKDNLIMRRACRRANLPEISFHDLRHCYAIEALSRGASMTEVAQNLGDSIAVCEEYYAGFGSGEAHVHMFARLKKS